MTPIGSSVLRAIRCLVKPRLLGAAALVCACAAFGADTVRLSVRLHPLSSDGEIRRVEVLETVEGMHASPGEPVFVVPARVTTIAGQPYGDGDVVAQDDEGPLTLSASIDQVPAGVPVQMRSFRANRELRGAVHLRYTADVTPAMTPRKAGPAFDLRGTEGGFGGAFFSFLLLPSPTLGAARYDLTWDLSGLPEGALGASNRGRGDVSWIAPLDEVWDTFLIGGRAHSYAEPGALFQAYWIGQPPFDATAAASWTTKSFKALKRFFRDTTSSTYVLLMRPYARPRDGGGAAEGGFMLEYGLGQMSDVSRRIMFTHEMVHHFVGVLNGDSSLNAWFGEGLAEFYKIRIPLREHLIDLPAAAREIAVMTNAYYTSPLVETPYSEVAHQRWAGSTAQIVPYNRGFMYFVDVDQKIRARSHGRRSLDDLVLTMVQDRREGKAYDEKRWRELLNIELGKSGVDDFDMMLKGRLIAPAADAFGPCMTRRMDKRTRPVLGFSEDALLMAPHVVSELDPMSAAAKAGLRNGDEIVAVTGATPRIAHSASNLRLEHLVRLTIRRDGDLVPLSFSTDGPQIIEFHWDILATIPSGCMP